MDEKDNTPKVNGLEKKLEKQRSLKPPSIRSDKVVTEGLGK